MALHSRGRKTVHANCPLCNFEQELVEFLVLERTAAFFIALFAARNVERFHLRVEHVLIGASIGQAFGFFVAEKCTMNTHRIRVVHGLVKHVATAKELFGTGMVHHRAGVNLRCHLEADTRRQVRLDDPRNDLHGRALRGKHQVDAHGTSLSRQASYGLFNFLAGDHHEVRHFVDNHDDKRHAVAAIFFRNFIRQFTRFKLCVKAADVTHLCRCQDFRTAVHFVAEPLERLDSNFRLRDDRRQKVRDVFVHFEFHRLRVHKNHAEFIRSLAEEHRCHERVNANRLTGTCLTSNQQVRRFGQIHRERFTRNVLP